MSEPTQDQNLHLPSLVIKNFRGIDELTIPRLGRVTLLAGKNGVGKTTVLDAVRIYTTRANGHIMLEVLRNRGDVMIQTDEKGSEAVIPDIASLFSNRQFPRRRIISIGAADDMNAVQIRLSDQRQTQLIRRVLSVSDVSAAMTVEARFGKEKFSLVYPYPLEFDPSLNVCNSLGPDLSTDAGIEHYWNKVALSPYEDVAVEALNLVSDVVVERVAVIDPSAGSKETYRRRLMAKIEGTDGPVPLRSLGDGAVRAFAVALALANSGGGFLLIDEAENGIHHSIQPKFWKMVLQTAQLNNVQVLATTHSWDCVTGFAHAANELEDVEGLLVRLERVPAGLKAITYDESRLAVVARSDIEVR